MSAPDAVRAFLASLRRRGITVRRKPDGDRLGRLKCVGRLGFNPASILTEADHAFIRAHLAELLAAVPAQSALPAALPAAPEADPLEPEPVGASRNDERKAPDRRTQVAPSPARGPTSKPAAGSPNPTAEPVISVRGHGRIDEDMVLEVLRDLGDELAADYRSGRLSKARAYAMAASYVRAHLDLGLVRIGSHWVQRGPVRLRSLVQNGN